MLAQRYQKKDVKNVTKITISLLKDADEACRSSEISVDLIISIVFL